MADRFHPYALPRHGASGAVCRIASASEHVRLPPLAILIREVSRHRSAEMSTAFCWKGDPLKPASPPSPDLCHNLSLGARTPPHSPIAVQAQNLNVSSLRQGGEFETADHELALKLLMMKQAIAGHAVHAAEARAKSAVMDMPSSALHVTGCKSIFDFTEHDLGVILLACWESNQVCVAVC